MSFRIVADQLSSVADTCYEIWQETSTPPSEADAFSDGEDLFLQQSLVSQTLHPETLGETFKTPTSVPTTSTVYPPWPAPSDQEFGNEVTNAAPARGVSSVQDPLDEAFETPASMPDISTPYPSWPAPSDQEVGNNAINAAPDHGVSSVQSLSERLKMRGKGRYFCPYGMSCNKGGIINGQLKEFNRNSDFRLFVFVIIISLSVTDKYIGHTCRSIRSSSSVICLIARTRLALRALINLSGTKPR